MQIKTRAIVLHSTKYGESQIIVDFFTEDIGRLSFAVRLAKSSKSKMKRQYFQPFMLLELEFDYRKNANLQKIKDLSVASPLADLPANPYKISICLFLSEFLRFSTRNEQCNRPLFSYLQMSIRWLDAAPTSVCANFHIVFMIRLSIFLGFFPNSDELQNPYFDMQEGRFVASPSLNGTCLGKEDSLKLRTLLRLNFQNMHLYAMSHHERNYCVGMILKYYKLHVPSFPELKTLAVLQELFA